MSVEKHQVVIVGGGFGGLYAARKLGSRAGVEVTLIDKRNFHLFQPLLYQVATGGLSPGDIASPLRAVLNRHANIEVVLGEVGDIDVAKQEVVAGDQRIRYDSLIVAAGARHHYFGNDTWEKFAPGIKTLEDALDMRQRIFQAFEEAELESDPVRRAALLTFVVVGGGPTGVELAGALGELSHFTLRKDFRHIRTAEAQLLLLEGGPKLLPTYSDRLGKRAAHSLQRLGVQIRLNTQVVDISQEQVRVRSGETEETIPCGNILWGAGVKAGRIATLLAERFGAVQDRSSRLIVQADLTLPGAPGVFVIGDMANFAHQGEHPLPGVAQVAMQQGEYAAALILDRLNGKSGRGAFRYRDKGNMAVIGRNAAVAEVGRLKLSGWSAWLMWVFVHIAYLIGFDSKFLVMFQWASNYFTRKRGARLITR